MGILEKISEIEKEIARTQKNKGEGPGQRGLSSRPPQFSCLQNGGDVSRGRAEAGSESLVLGQAPKCARGRTGQDAGPPPSTL